MALPGAVQHAKLPQLQHLVTLELYRHTTGAADAWNSQQEPQKLLAATVGVPLTVWGFAVPLLSTPQPTDNKQCRKVQKSGHLRQVYEGTRIATS